MVDRNRSICFTDPELRKSRFKNTGYVNPRAFEIAKNYADNRLAVKKENLGLLLWGDVGTGKSRLAACIANEFLEAEERVLMSNMGRFLNLGIREQEILISEIHRYGLVIFDDLGTERQTPFSLEMIFRLIDARYVSKLPTVITTNLTLEELKNPPDLPRRRIYSRILEMCTPVYVSGRNIREKIAADKMQQLRRGLQQDSLT